MILLKFDNVVTPSLISFIKQQPNFSTETVPVSISGCHLLFHIILPHVCWACMLNHKSAPLDIHGLPPFFFCPSLELHIQMHPLKCAMCNVTKLIS